MTSRPYKIREIFAELRVVYGDTVSAKDLLQSAAKIVDTHTKFKQKQHHYFSDGRRSFEELDIDEAIADGGWKVLRREGAWIAQMYDDYVPNPEVIKFARSLQMELI